MSNPNGSVQPQKVVYIRENGTRGVRTVHPGESMTQQQFKDDCDVNIMLAKFMKTNDPAHLRLRDAGVYADLAGAPDYMEAMQTIATANQAFEAIDARIRLDKFNNDPQKMIQFLADPQNQEEAIKLGLMVRRPEAPKDPVLEELRSMNENIQANTRKSKKDQSEA